MTLEDLDAIEERAKAEHPDPYCAGPVDEWHMGWICAARSNVPALVAEVRRLHAEIERIQNAHEAEMEDRNWRETE